MNRLIFPPRGAHGLRELLLSSQLETAGILLTQAIHVKPGEHRLIYRDFFLASADAYTVREGDRVELHPNFLAAALKKARSSNLSVILCHTHPRNGPVRASVIDREGERRLMPTFYGRVPGTVHGRLIVGHRDYDAAILSADANLEFSLRAMEVGRELRELPWIDEDWDDATLDRYDRQVRMFGASGQAVLRRCRVGIVGVGGTGSIVAQELAYLGVRDFLLLDPDSVDSSNLNRIAGATPNDVGEKKVLVSERLITSIQPKADVHAVVGSANLNRIAKELLTCDFAFVCTDSHGSRAVLNQLAYQYFLPMIDVGVRIDARDGKVFQISGRAQMLGPGLSCLVCSNLLDSETVRRDLMTEYERQQDPYIVGTPEPQPAVISINGTISSLAVSMFLAAVTGIPMHSRYQIYRGEVGTVRSIANEPQWNCIVCSPSGALGKADDWPLPGRNDLQ